MSGAFLVSLFVTVVAVVYWRFTLVLLLASVLALLAIGANSLADTVGAPGPTPAGSITKPVDDRPH